MMNWYTLVDGKLYFIGKCPDWDAAYAVTCDSFGEVEWTWIASQHEVDQWVDVITSTERGQSL